jgi:hypothetical protein
MYRFFCKNCGCKLTHKGRPLTRKYVHVYKNKYGVWWSSKSYNGCNDPIPDNE